MTDTVSAPPYGMTVWHVDPTAGIGAPAAGSFRTDSVSIPTILAVDAVDKDAAAFDFTQVTAGDRLVLQQLRRATHYWAFDMAALTDHTTWWEIPVKVIGSDNGVIAPAQDYLFVFRHAGPEDGVVAPPATLVPADQRAALISAVTVALQGEVNADVDRDGAKLNLAVRAAIESVETYLDMVVSPWATADEIPARVFKALVDIATGETRRAGFAYGLAGYDEADPMATRAYGAIRAELAPGLKQRWGVA